MMKRHTLHSKIGRGILQSGLSVMLLSGIPLLGAAQTTENSAETTSQQLVRMGYENVRWIENESERIYTV
jgi:hypothetical protein